MKTLFAQFNYFDGISLTKNDANYCTHSGACDNEVKEISEKRYVKKQLSKIDKEALKKELKEYGAWDEKELENHEDNIQRILWIAAGNIVDE